MSYNNFQVSQGVQLIRNYLKIQPKKISSADDEECNAIRTTDVALKKAYDNIFHLLSKKLVPHFGLRFPNIDTAKLIKKCCTCPNEDGISHSEKNNVRASAISAMTLWVQPAEEYISQDYQKEEIITSKYRNKRKVSKKRRG